jgi:acetyl-CoA acetyltransferase
MRSVAVVGFASQVRSASGGLNDAELLAPVVDGALQSSGLSPRQIGVVCSASSEFLNGVIGSVNGAFDALPCWPPVTHTHLEGDGAFALYEAWVRLLAGEADAALVCAYSRPLALDPASLFNMQLDPYLMAPFAPGRSAVAALQARALLDEGPYRERDFAGVVSARRRETTVEEVLAQPYVASPLRAPDCSTICFGAAAVVLAAEGHESKAQGVPAWIKGMDQRVESGSLGRRRLTFSDSTAAAAGRLGLTGSAVDVLELHAPFSHQELILLDALGTSTVKEVNPTGGALPADPVMVTGLIRIGEAASAILRGDAQRAVGHATNGPCLQHNLLCLLECDP